MRCIAPLANVDMEIFVFTYLSIATIYRHTYIMFARMRSRGTLYVMYNALYKRYIYYYLMLINIYIYYYFIFMLINIYITNRQVTLGEVIDIR